MQPLRSRTQTQTVMMLAWAGLLCFGLGRVMLNSAAASVTRLVPVMHSSSDGLSNVVNGWTFVNQPGALRPGAELVPAGSCGSVYPPEPPAPINQTLEFEVNKQGQAIATFIDESQIYLYLPQRPSGAGTYEVRLWVVDNKNRGLGNAGNTDISAELLQGGFPSLSSANLRDLKPVGALAGKVSLESGGNTLAVRLRRALPDADVSQIATFNIAVP